MTDLCYTEKKRLKREREREREREGERERNLRCFETCNDRPVLHREEKIEERERERERGRERAKLKVF